MARIRRPSRSRTTADVWSHVSRVIVLLAPSLEDPEPRAAGPGVQADLVVRGPERPPRRDGPAVLPQPAKPVLHQAVLQGVERDHPEPTSGREQVRGLGQRRPEAAQLIV